ncbi:MULTISPECIES: hypothetical protein [Halorubrum]|jgi:hypothetical protein|uniref:hypothetical protein n=1 Tax=Halorubrum TaxID=56688 RepID=UPI000A2E4249|nr:MULTISPECIES: hypothetical protein [Halorubrum]MDB2237876.1 hypothetical protein [Halorubrum ezzemoulense]MDB2249470.1 hypothetical protein [Halorubrum ezzemoulense]MDB2271668.1 hypothetical protein [Halorubrum ezzemoulense]MDB2280681.1 hypothetical protein [Halorubrum ezzemoulense]MDB9251296.1 hypothetical protein [Halorubrum ezzemoulense]
MLPAPFRLFFVAVPLLVSAGALAMAAFPRKMTSWQTRSPDGSTGRIEPSDTRILLMRVMGVVVAALALLMAFGTFSFIP